MPVGPGVEEPPRTAAGATPTSRPPSGSLYERAEDHPSRRIASASPTLAASLCRLGDAEITVLHRPDERRYELLFGGEHAGELLYRERSPNVVAFLHTEIDPALERRGLGSALVAGALNDVRERGLSVVPLCPFVEAYIRRNPGYADLVADDPARRV